MVTSVEREDISARKKFNGKSFYELFTLKDKHERPAKTETGLTKLEEALMFIQYFDSSWDDDWPFVESPTDVLKVYVDYYNVSDDRLEILTRKAIAYREDYIKELNSQWH